MDKKNLFYQIAFIVMFISINLPVFSNENSQIKVDKYSIGVGEIIKTNSRISDTANGKGEDIKLKTIPLLKIRLGPIQIGESGLTISILGNREKAIYLNLNRNSDGFQYQGLSKKRNSWLLGAGLKLKNFSFLYSRDIDGNSKGKKINLNYLNILNINSSFTLVSTIGLSFYDQKYSDYYYGVNNEEAEMINIPRYQAAGYILPHIGIIPSVRFGEFSIFAANTFKFMPEEIRKSPTVKNHFVDYALILGFFWHF